MGVAVRLKLYRGARMAEAMASVRAELGAEAFILSSRRVSGGFEVTAALPRAADDQAATALAVRGRALRFHGVPAALAGRLMHATLSEALQGCLDFAEQTFERATRPVVFVGPPGAGKTLTVTRLAARLIVSGAKPVVVTSDCQKAGANEQLAALLDVLGLELTVCEPLDLAGLLAQPRESGPVFVDTAGSNPFDPLECQQLRQLIAQTGALAALVLPTGLAPEEAAEMAIAYRDAGVECLVATRLDVARRLGGVLAAGGCGLRMTEAGIGASVMEGLEPMTAELLAARLLQVPKGWMADDAP